MSAILDNFDWQITTFFMPKELYFDISSEDSGGSLYRVPEGNGEVAFLYNYSISDTASGEVEVFDKWYVSWEAFWKALTEDPEWYYRHPLFVHPEQREFVREALKRVNWGVHPDKKWQDSHQRQWKKVLEDPGAYYRGPQAS
jgi:hypothetical protein